MPLVEATTLTYLGKNTAHYGRIRSWGSIGFIVAVVGLGYAFDYPEAWHIIALPEVPGSTVTITSWDPDNLSGERPQGEGIPEGGEKMEIMEINVK